MGAGRRPACLQESHWSPGLCPPGLTRPQKTGLLLQDVPAGPRSPAPAWSPRPVHSPTSHTISVPIRHHLETCPATCSRCSPTICPQSGHPPIHPATWVSTHLCHLGLQPSLSPLLLARTHPCTYSPPSPTAPSNCPPAPSHSSIPPSIHPPAHQPADPASRLHSLHPPATEHHLSSLQFTHTSPSPPFTGTSPAHHPVCPTRQPSVPCVHRARPLIRRVGEL